MKKKRIIALIIVVVFLAIAFSGCSLVRENEERAANETLATVTSDGITLTVTKNEMLSYANYMLRQYSQYDYEPDLETFMPEILDYMINQKYLTIKGMVYLQSLEHRQDVMVANNMNVPANSPEGVLTLAERYKAIAAVNETFEDEIQEYIEEYEQEQITRQISEARREVENNLDSGFVIDSIELAEGSLKSEYLMNEDYDKSKIMININMISADDTQTITMPVSSTMYDEGKAFSTELSQDEQSKKVVTKEVVVVFEEPITTEDDETDFIIHKSQAVEYKIVIPRGTAQTEEEENQLEGQVPDRYKSLGEISEENVAEIFDYNPSGPLTIKEQEAYRQFRQAKRDMLINFEEDGLNYYYRNQFESQVLEAVRHELGQDALNKLSDEDLQQSVEYQYSVLVQKQIEEYNIINSDEAKVRKFNESLKDGTMSLEEVYYAPLEALQNEGHTLEEFFSIAHILFRFSDTQNSFIEREKGNRDEEDLWNLKDMVAQYTSTSRSNPDYDPDYDCPEHKYNEGDCIYEGEGICPSLAFDPENLEEELFGEGGIYQRISADIAAANTPEEKLEIFKDYMALYNDDGGAMTSATGYLIPPEGIAHGYDGDDFPGLARKLFEENPEVGSAFLTDGESYLGYAFTSYGIHLMMISFIPFQDAAAVDANGVVNIDTALDSNGLTHRQILEDEIKEEVKSNAYSQFTKTNDSEQAKEAAQKDAKKFNKLLKDLGIK